MSRPYTHHIPRKAIAVPSSHPVDISELLPIVDHPIVQRLRFRKQLGVNFLVFPGAVHTRFEHSIGVLGLIQRICTMRHMEEEERRLICTFALLHDLGHGPFSHQIEPILEEDHHDRGLRLLENMKTELAACAISVDALKKCFSGEEEQAILVSDRNLGADKLDYLQRDALHIGFTGVPDIEKILLYSVCADGRLGIEEKFTEEIKRLQKFYSYLHQHGYLNKTALSVQRIFQRAVQEILIDNEAAPDQLWEMTDDRLMHLLYTSDNLTATRLVRLLEGRDFHRSFMVIKAQEYGFVERVGDKHVAVVEWDRNSLRRFGEIFSDCREVLRVENKLCKFLGFDTGDILLAAMPFFEKLVPRDIRIYSSGNDADFQLFEKDRNHFNSLEADYLSTFAIRLVCPPHLRKKAASAVSELIDILEEELRNGATND